MCNHENHTNFKDKLREWTLHTQIAIPRCKDRDSSIQGGVDMATVYKSNGFI